MDAQEYIAASLIWLRVARDHVQAAIATEYPDPDDADLDDKVYESLSDLSDDVDNAIAAARDVKDTLEKADE